MLCITRKINSSFTIYLKDNEEITITICAIKGRQATIGIDADKKYSILRDDIIKRKGIK